MKLALKFPFTVTPKMITTFSYFAAFTALGMASASLGPTLPGLAKQTQTQLSQISFLFSARSLGYVVGALQGGRLYDRVAGHTVMAGALLLMIFMMFLIPLMPLLWLLTAVLLLLGIAESALDVGGNTLLVWTHGHKVGPFMNALHFFFGLGAFLSPIIIAQAVVAGGGITLGYWILALLWIPVLFWVYRMPSPAIYTKSKTSTDSKTNYLLVFLIALFLFLYVGAEVGFGGWIFTYTVSLNLANETVAAYLTSAFWGAVTVGRLLSIPLAVHFRPSTLLLGDMFGCLLSISIILLWPASLTVVWLGTFGIGLSMASIFPLTISLAERRLALNGQITGWFLVGASIGAMSIPWLIGQFFESAGPQIMMIIIAIDLLMTLFILVVLLFFTRHAVDQKNNGR